jgi:hypothetical protein
MLRLFLLTALFAGAAAPAFAAAAEETWLRVSIDGRKIGHLQSTRDVLGDTVESTQRLALEVERDGQRIAFTSEEAATESLDGHPLAFAASLSMAGSASHSRGRPLGDGQWQLRITQAGQERVSAFDWPEGALLAEGQRLAEAAAGREPGTRYRLRAFDPGSLQPIDITAEVAASEYLRLPEGERQALRIDQQLDLGGARMQSRTWVDAEGRVLRSVMPLFGLELEMLACSRDCATAPNQPADILAATSLPAPRALGRSERRAALRFALDADASLIDALRDVPGQQAGLDADGRPWLHIDPAGASTPTPDGSHLAANRWLQSDAPELIEAARSATRGVEAPAARMQALESFVRGHIETKSLRIGYASALEVLSLREGDCTEHAVLLAALARALEIPAMVVTGLAYAEEFAGRRDHFVPHAWVMAWVDGRWRGFDAALDGHGAAHIGLGAGDGEPFRFYRGIEALGRLQVASIAPVEDAP